MAPLDVAANSVRHDAVRTASHWIVQLKIWLLKSEPLPMEPPKLQHSRKVVADTLTPVPFGHSERGVEAPIVITAASSAQETGHVPIDDVTCVASSRDVTAFE